jgi:hypothetical protein
VVRLVAAILQIERRAMERNLALKLREFLGNDIRPYLSANDRKPLTTQLREAAALYRRYRLPPYQYLRAGLYLRTAPASVDAYMPTRVLWALRESLNPPEARQIARDKMLFRKHMEAAGLPVLREALSIDQAGTIHDASEKILNRTEALRLLRNAEFFVKPVDGIWGAGTRLLLPGDDLDEFLKTARNVVVQPRLRQHALLQRLYPHAVNTVRIDSLRVDEGWVSNAAVLKFGIGGSIVDNGSAGGLTVGIDISTGALQPVGRQKPKFSTAVHRCHPDTGASFEGLVIPHWDLLRKTVFRAAEAMLPLKSLGWDVAITETGVILLEANDNWNIDLFQTGWGGLGDTPIGRMACELRRTQ